MTGRQVLKAVPCRSNSSKYGLVPGLLFSSSSLPRHMADIGIEMGRNMLCNVVFVLRYARIEPYLLGVC